jgi:hypothetical protein
MPLNDRGYSKIINAVKRQRNLGLIGSKHSRHGMLELDQVHMT